jgi:hypothetical protein
MEHTAPNDPAAWVQFPIQYLLAMVSAFGYTAAGRIYSLNSVANE